MFLKSVDTYIQEGKNKKAAYEKFLNEKEQCIDEMCKETKYSKKQLMEMDNNTLYEMYKKIKKAK